jgi:tetratricopeptide (TPR) repeat protein
MLWHCFQDWRDRRSALRDLSQKQQAEEAALMDQNLNPLNMARMALASAPAEAASRWERARELVPNAVLASPDSLHILLDLQRYDEADALMRERRKRLRGDRFCLTGLARIAERRGDTAEALRRWEVVRSRVRDTIEGYLGCARCLVDLGRVKEAETQLNRALRRDPYSLEVKMARARISDRCKDWMQSLARWKPIAEVDRNPQAFAFAARAMIELGQLEEAEAWLAEPSRLFITDLEIAMTHADLAQRRGDVIAACDRWATVRAIDQYSYAGYHDGAYRLVEAKRQAEAEAVLREAAVRFPDQIWPLQNFARIAHDRRDWNEAAARWEAMRQRFPAEQIGYSQGAEALTAAGRDDEAAVLRGTL